MINIGQSFSFYLDEKKGLLILETRNFGPVAYKIEIPVEKVGKYIRPMLKKGQKLKELKKVPVQLKTIYEKEND